MARSSSPILQTVASVAACLGAAFLLASVKAADAPKPLQIGMAKSFFRDIPKTIVGIILHDFKEVMHKTTGLDGTLVAKYGAVEMADRLDKGHLDFGIFQGHEFAWLQKEYPELQPLVIAADKELEERAFLVVHKNSPVKTIGDLRGKKLAMPRLSKEYCRVFISMLCTGNPQKEPGEFFASLEKPASYIDALDDVGRDKVQAALIDNSDLAFYKEIKGPVFAKNLRILERSEPFPPVVIAYKPNGSDESTVNRFRAGLLKAHTTDLGRELMKRSKFEAFIPIPRDYAKMLTK